jgi:hypothetical protein
MPVARLRHGDGAWRASLRRRASLSNDALNPTVASRPSGSLVRFFGRVAIRRPAPAG